MTEPPKARVEMRDFPGLVTNADPDDIQAGAAQVQNNILVVRSGELEVRAGYRAVRFEEE